MILNKTELMQATKQNYIKILDNIEDIKRILSSNKLNKNQKQDFILQDVEDIKKHIQQALKDEYNMSIDEL